MVIKVKKLKMCGARLLGQPQVITEAVAARSIRGKKSA
jgi:hypothetical protein